MFTTTNDSVSDTRVEAAQLCCKMAKVTKKKSAKNIAKRVKKRSNVTEEKPEVAYDEEEENISSEEEEEVKEDGLDERKHQKLLEAISSLGGER